MGPLIHSCREFDKAENWDSLAWLFHTCSTSEILYMNRYEIKTVKGHKIAYRIMHLRSDGVYKCVDGRFRRFPNRLGYPQYRAEIKARVEEARQLAFPPPPPALATPPAIHV